MSEADILHVEDDSNDVLLFQQACSKAGLNSHLQVVTDGDDAIDYLEGNKQFANREQYPVPDLVVLDLKMPRLSGFEVISWMRRNDKCRHLPVIVLSSSNQNADVKRAYSLGANSYLLKPVSFDSLVETVKRIHQYWLTLNIQSQTDRVRQSL